MCEQVLAHSLVSKLAAFLLLPNKKEGRLLSSIKITEITETGNSLYLEHLSSHKGPIHEKECNALNGVIIIQHLPCQTSVICCRAPCAGNTNPCR